MGLALAVWTSPRPNNDAEAARVWLELQAEVAPRSGQPSADNLRQFALEMRKYEEKRQLEIEVHSRYVVLHVPWPDVDVIASRAGELGNVLDLVLFDLQARKLVSSSTWWSEYSRRGSASMERLERVIDSVLAEGEDPTTEFVNLLDAQGIAWESATARSEHAASWVDGFGHLLAVPEADQSPEALRALEESVSSDDRFERRHAITRLTGWSRSPAVLRILRSALMDPDLVARAYAAQALGVLGDDASLPDILRVAEESLVTRDEWAEESMLAAAHGAACLWRSAPTRSKQRVARVVELALTALPEGFGRQRIGLRKAIEGS